MYDNRKELSLKHILKLRPKRLNHDCLSLPSCRRNVNYITAQTEKTEAENLTSYRRHHWKYKPVRRYSKFLTVDEQESVYSRNVSVHPFRTHAICSDIFID
jgi:hypothetical protein